MSEQWWAVRETSRWLEEQATAWDRTAESAQAVPDAAADYRAKAAALRAMLKHVSAFQRTGEPADEPAKEPT